MSVGLNFIKTMGRGIKAYFYKMKFKRKELNTQYYKSKYKVYNNEYKEFLRDIKRFILLNSLALLSIMLSVLFYLF